MLLVFKWMLTITSGKLNSSNWLLENVNGLWECKPLTRFQMKKWKLQEWHNLLSKPISKKLLSENTWNLDKNLTFRQRIFFSCNSGPFSKDLGFSHLFSFKQGKLPFNLVCQICNFPVEDKKKKAFEPWQCGNVPTFLLGEVSLEIRCPPLYSESGKQKKKGL